MRRMNSILTLTLLGVLVLATCASSASATSEWTMDISAVMVGDTPVTADLTYGVSSTATDGFDAGVDADAPPADPSGFDAYFTELGASTGKLNVNIKSVGDPRTWTLLVVAPSGKTVDASWTPANIPSDVDMQIQELDLTTGELTGSSIDMNTQDKVTVTGGAFAATTKGYRITATTGAAPTCTVSVTNTAIVPPQTTDITVTFSEYVQYTLNIETSDGAVVYDWTGTRSTDRTVTWGGSYEVDGTQVLDGTYTVNLTVTNTTTELTGSNKTETIGVSSTVVNLPPTAVIASPTATGTYHVDEEVSFLSTGSTDTDGTIVSHTWDFGDGSTGTGVSTTHTYTTTGSMTVTLTVTDDDGAPDTETVTINVLPPEVSVTLYEGWNLMAVPVNDPTADTAAELALKITGCKEVVMWDAAEDEYVTYTKIGDDWTGTGFAITGGMGIFVSVEGDTTVGFTGDAWS